MAQILSRILLKSQVIMVCDECSKDIIESMGMIWCPDIDSALNTAYSLTGKESKITVIPDGISVIVE